MASALAQVEYIARWAKAMAGITAVVVGFAAWMLLTASQYANLPERLDNHVSDYEALKQQVVGHMAGAQQEDRAQTCMLMQMMEGRDPSGCTRFLPRDDAHYTP